MSEGSTVFSPVVRGLAVQYPLRKVQWKTLGTFVAAISILGISFSILAGSKASWVIIPLNSLALYLIYIVMHDASHDAIFQSSRANKVIGHFTVFLFHPGFAFETFKMIHLRHHYFTNEADKDPDLWANASFKWLLPLKWMTTDLGYAVYTLKHWHKLTQSAKTHQILQLGFFCLYVTLMVQWSLFGVFMIFWVIPFRIAMFFLTFFLDYLPHVPYQHTQRKKPFGATRIITSRLDKLLFWIMLGQNYHLSHHLFPELPFFATKRIWDQIEDETKANALKH